MFIGNCINGSLGKHIKSQHMYTCERTRLNSVIIWNRRADRLPCQVSSFFFPRKDEQKKKASSFSFAQHYIAYVFFGFQVLAVDSTNIVSWTYPNFSGCSLLVGNWQLTTIQAVWHQLNYLLQQPLFLFYFASTQSLRRPRSTSYNCTPLDREFNAPIKA